MNHRRYRVRATATDPLTLLGITEMLGAHEDTLVLANQCGDFPDVVVFAAHEMSPDTFSHLRAQSETTDAPVVLIADDFSGVPSALMADCHVRTILPRADISAQRLVRAVTCTAEGGAVIPNQLLGRLLDELTDERRSLHLSLGLTTAGMTAREIDALKLFSMGWNTTEVSKKLDCAEGTLKNVISTLLVRLGLRNRSHAVSYAINAGII